MVQISNPWGVVAVLILLLFFPIAGLIHMFRPVVLPRLDFKASPHRAQTKLLPVTHNAINSDNYQPPPHVHQIDLERGSITVTDSGGVFARCCVQGCEQGVYLGPNVASAWKKRQGKRC